MHSSPDLIISFTSHSSRPDDCTAPAYDRQPCQHLIAQFSTGRMLFLTPSQQWQSIKGSHHQHHTTTILQPFFRDHPSEPVPLENFLTLWCKGRLTEADTLTIWQGATLSGLTSAHLHHPSFLQTRCSSCHPTNSVKAPKAVTSPGNSLEENILAMHALYEARQKHSLLKSRPEFESENK